MGRTVVLYRGSLFEPEELEAAKKSLFCTNSRLDIGKDDLVIGRYSVLPFYKEQEEDIIRLGGRLINTYYQHQWIADLGCWAGREGALEGLTPPALTLNEYAASSLKGPFVLKGATNSKKHHWKTHMFASTREDVGVVAGRLMSDGLIGGQQEIYVRPFELLHTFSIGLNGLPITKEFRFFGYKGQVVSGGFYWASHREELLDGGVPESELDQVQVPEDFLAAVVERVKPHADFFAVDVAQKSNGDWIVVEVNDGQMAGLSCNDPEILYRHIRLVEEGTLRHEG